MLSKVKLALRISTSDFDNDLNQLIAAGKQDIEIVGVEFREDDPLMVRALITYCKLYFGEPDNFYNLNEAYKQMKGQIRENSRYKEQ